MRILFLIQWFDPEPGVSHGLPLARSLTQRGEQVKVLTGFPNYPGGRLYPGYKIRPWQKEQIDGVPVNRIPLYPSHDSSALHRAINYASFALSASTIGLPAGRNADVAYVYHGGAMVGLPAILLKTAWRLPFVYDIADMWPESITESGMISSERTRRIVESVVSRWCRIVYKAAAQITVLSPGFKRLLIERGVEGSKVHVIYNWADEEVFFPLPRDEDFARQVGIDTSAFNVLYAGNIGAFQGIDTILKAAALLDQTPDIRFTIVGTGQREAEMRALADRMKLTNVRFLGQQPYKTIPKLSPLADVLLVHLNDHKFFSTTVPGKTQVSLATGRPIVMGVRGDAADLVRRAEAGLVCEPENPEAMAAAVRQLYEMPRERREQMGQNGRRFYLSELSLDRATRHMQEIFAEARTSHR